VILSWSGIITAMLALQQQRPTKPKEELAAILKKNLPPAF
jgi:hypothetical protein